MCIQYNLRQVELPTDAEQALQWQSGLSDEEIMRDRDSILNTLEEAANVMWQQGLCQKWLEGADPQVAVVSKTVNGIIFEDLAKTVQDPDLEMIQAFRTGADFMGLLPVSGREMPRRGTGTCADPDNLKKDCGRSNRVLLAKLKADEHEDELQRLTEEDAKLGRMSWPRPAAECDLESIRLCPRFAVVQGLKADGTTKIRAIDNLSWSAQPPEEKGSFGKKRKKELSVNGHTEVPEEIHHDHIDILMSAMRRFILLMGVVPGLLKADIDSAFRRIPLKPSHRWAAGVAYMRNGVQMVSTHMANPFGASSSVYSWERVGSLLCSIARRLLHIATFRYVDDFFAPERPGTMEHAMQCLARLVRLLLGATAIANRKLECGLSLVVLGVQIKLSQQGAAMMPDRAKVVKCLATIELALKTCILTAGCAQKLAGRLSWATQFMFFKLGRAMIRPIFDQKRSRDGSMTRDSPLYVALKWWRRVLAMDLCEVHEWAADKKPVAHLFVDAAGSPARCAAVLFLDGKWSYTDGKPSAALMNRLNDRCDNQIMALETMAIALGLSTFEEELEQRSVIVYSDNKGAEAATRKGTAKSWDHCQLIHEIWSHAAGNKMGVWIVRVPSDDNISDLPSRFEYGMLEELGAVWRAPGIAKPMLEDL